MRKKELTANIFAVRLTKDTFEIVEKACNGRIRGTSLPIEQRVVQFDSQQYPDQGEQNIRVGDWLVQFRSQGLVINQCWSNEAATQFFKDNDDVTF